MDLTGGLKRLIDLLPRSLRTLRLTDCSKKHIEVLVDNVRDLSHREDMFPHSERLEVATMVAVAGFQPFFSLMPYDKPFTVVRAACEAVGVKFDLALLDRDDIEFEIERYRGEEDSDNYEDSEDSEGEE
ncbi:hypothetical protein BDW74DRAFT_176677 [Aspergillus multicolor]|uniref:uncharacterized protein n=1 Tax=Aspergillus multicolor TaxID=41759 RepID=UPI003CCE0658